MDRRQFNKIVAASIPAAIGASFLPSADAKYPIFEVKADHPGWTLNSIKGTNSEDVKALVGERTLKQGEHIFGGLIDGTTPLGAFYYPHQPIYEWLYKINYQYVVPAYCGSAHRSNDHPYNWHKNATNLVWTDHWHFQNQTTVHEKIPPFGKSRLRIIFMWDNFNNFMSWVPNSHKVGGNKPPRMANVMLHTVNEMPVHNGFISMCKGRPWKWNGNSIETFKTMPYPAQILRYS